MIVTEHTKLKEIDEAYPNFRSVGAVKYPILKKATGFAWMMAKNLTVREAANKAGMSVSELLAKINEVISMC